jgi:hypothetical protein
MSYFIKLLRHAEPTFLNRLGILVEAPTFLSPQIVGSYRCTLCKATYSPLIYAPTAPVDSGGQPVPAHHSAPVARGDTRLTRMAYACRSYGSDEGMRPRRRPDQGVVAQSGALPDLS